jgi:hypothetical protein
MLREENLIYGPTGLHLYGSGKGLFALKVSESVIISKEFCSGNEEIEL